MEKGAIHDPRVMAHHVNGLCGDRMCAAAAQWKNTGRTQAHTGPLTPTLQMLVTTCMDWLDLGPVVESIHKVV